MLGLITVGVSILHATRRVQRMALAVIALYLASVIELGLLFGPYGVGCGSVVHRYAGVPGCGAAASTRTAWVIGLGAVMASLVAVVLTDRSRPGAASRST